MLEFKTKKKMLKEKSSESKLSQSDFIRNLIDDFKEDSLSNSDISHIVYNLLEITDNLLKLKKITI